MFKCCVLLDHIYMCLCYLLISLLAMEILLLIQLTTICQFRFDFNGTIECAIMNLNPDPYSI